MKNLIFFSFFLFSCQPRSITQLSSDSSSEVVAPESSKQKFQKRNLSEERESFLNFCPIDYSKYVECYTEKFNYFTEKYKKDIEEMSHEGGVLFMNMIGSAVSSYCNRESMLKEKLDKISQSKKNKCFEEMKTAGLNLDELFKKKENQ